MKKIYILLLVSLLTSSCGIDIGNDGVKVDVPGAKVDIGDNGVKIDAPGTSIDIGDNGVKIDAPGAKIDIGDNGVKINAPGTNIDIGNTSGKVPKTENSLLSLVINTDSVKNISDEERQQYKELVTQELEVTNCKQQFNQLVQTFGNNYDSCFANRKVKNECNSDIKAAKVNIAIVLDASGSMNKKVSGESMMEIAKDEVQNYISDLDSKIGGGVFVYGHKGNSSEAQKEISCGGIQKIGNFTEKDTLNSEISGLEAIGWTPIDKALEKANKYLNNISGEHDQKIIILVSDGKETCDGNPIARAKQIAQQKNTYIDVIGFNVYGETQNQLAQIAKNGEGKYTNVSSRLDFQNVFADMKAFSKEVQCGASQASIQLRNAANTLDTYYSCMYNLREEEVHIMPHVTLFCESEITSLMENRVDTILNKLKEIKTSAESQLESFEESIESVLQKF